MTDCGHSYPQRMVRQRVENFSPLKSAPISRTAFKICFTVILLFLQITDKTNEENFLQGVNAIKSVLKCTFQLLPYPLERGLQILHF